MGAKVKRKGKKTFEPVDFDKELRVGDTVMYTPPEPVKKTFKEVFATISREIELVQAGVSVNTSFAIQVVPSKNPFCRLLSVVKDPLTGQQAQELIRLAFQEFGNKFAGFVKEELRNLF